MRHDEWEKLELGDLLVDNFGQGYIVHDRGHARFGAKVVCRSLRIVNPDDWEVVKRSIDEVEELKKRERKKMRFRALMGQEAAHRFPRLYEAELKKAEKVIEESDYVTRLVEALSEEDYG